MRTRRELIAGLAAVVPLAGCSGSPESPRSTTGRTATTDTPTSDDGGATTTRSTNTETETEDVPPLNETSFPVARQKLDDRLFPESDLPSLHLWTTDDWRDGARTELLAESCRSLVAETDFASESVLALESRVSAGGNRWIVEGIDGVGTDALTMRVREYESGSGLNNAPLRLVAVRVPNDGTEPTSAVAHLGEDSQISTEGT